MITLANTTMSSAASASVTLTWITPPGGSPDDGPTAGAPARAGPLPGAPPALAARHADSDELVALAVAS
jgi:hypothetical protein